MEGRAFSAFSCSLASGRRPWRRALDKQSQNESKPPSTGDLKAKKNFTNWALAMELPFTIVGAVLLGALLGYFLDHWLHTKVIFTFLLGGLGFAGGLKEVLRRLG
jgi:F0F1-type ATP synthase assembly protein I